MKPSYGNSLKDQISTDTNRIYSKVIESSCWIMIVQVTVAEYYYKY